MNIGNILSKIMMSGLLLSSAALAADQMRLEVPIHGEMGITSAIVFFTPALVPGQTFNLYSNGHLVCSVKPVGFGIERILSYLIMTKPGNIEASIADQQGKELSSISKPFDFTVTQPTPSSGGPVLKASQLKLQSSGKRVSIYYPQIRGDSQINISTAAGELKLLVTPYLFKSLFRFWADKELGHVTISIESPQP